MAPKAVAYIAETELLEYYSSGYGKKYYQCEKCSGLNH